MKKLLSSMKNVLKWLVAFIFAFQAVGGTLYLHLACCDDSDGQQAALRHDSARDSQGRAASGIDRGSGQPYGPAKPFHQHHEPRTCIICQVLLTFSATPSIPPALPTIVQAVIRRPMPADRSVIDVFLAAIDARGPPLSTLL